MELLISVSSFIIILAAIVFLRNKHSNLDIKTPDIIVAILPVLIFLIVSGKLSRFELSESGLKIETAITEAANSHIEGLEMSLDIEKLPVEVIRACLSFII